AASAVTDCLGDANEGVRRAAVAMLLKLNRDITPELLKLLKDKNVEVRRGAAAALAELGPKAKNAAPALIEALKDSDAAVRLSAVLALKDMKLDVKAVHPLVALLRDRDATIRQGAMAALGQFRSGADPAVPVLGELLKSKDDEDRKQAAELLGKIGKASVL